MELRELLQNITPPDEAAREQAHRRWAACAKPLGSLGLLETALEDIAALTGDAQAPLLPRAVLVLCADNGVVAQGVTQTDSSVTAAVTRNLAAGRTSVCRMAQAAQCAVVPVDMGVRDFAPQPGVLARRIRRTRSTMTALVEKLERAGYVERRPDPADARGVLVCLTDRGKALAPVMDGVSRALEALVASRLSAEEADALERLLSRCVGE